MPALTIVKVGVHIVSAFGVAKVMGDVIRSNTSVVTTTDKVLVTAGSFVIGSMVGQAASKHVKEQMENVIQWHENREGDATA